MSLDRLTDYRTRVHHTADQCAFEQCPYCGCCAHGKPVATGCKVETGPIGMGCPNGDCGCVGVDA